MGAGASKPASLPVPKISSDGAPIAPDRTQRSQCWEARDIYYGCLDKHDILDGIAEKDKAAKVCAAEGRGFESNCAESWVCIGIDFKT
jgi:cytochrome c oxidase assembly factor 6